MNRSELSNFKRHSSCAEISVKSKGCCSSAKRDQVVWSERIPFAQQPSNLFSKTAKSIAEDETAQLQWKMPPSSYPKAQKLPTDPTLGQRSSAGQKQ